MNIDKSERTCVIVRIKSKTILYLLKSLDAMQFRPKLNILDRLRVESGFNAQMCQFAYEFTAIRRLISRFKAEEEYTAKKIIDAMPSLNDAAKFIVDHLAASNEIRKITVAYMNKFIQSPYAAMFSSLYFRSETELICKGVLPEMFVRIEINPITSEYIQTLIRRSTILTNEATLRDYYPVFNGSSIRNAITRKSVLHLIANSSTDAFVLEMPVSYEVKHDKTNMFNDSKISVTKDESTVDLRKRLILPKLTLCMSSVDTREFVYDDDYVIQLYGIMSGRPMRVHTQSAYAPLDLFLTRLGSISTVQTVICETSLTQRSIYDWDLERNKMLNT